MKKKIENMLIDTLLSDSFSEILDKESAQLINSVFIQEIESGVLLDYFEIIHNYNLKKNDCLLTTQQISKMCGLPELTIGRVENMQVVPKILTLQKMLKAVGLKLCVQPITLKE